MFYRSQVNAINMNLYKHAKDNDINLRRDIMKYQKAFLQKHGYKILKRDIIVNAIKEIGIETMEDYRKMKTTHKMGALLTSAIRKYIGREV